MILTQQLILKSDKPAVIKQAYNSINQPKIKKVDVYKLKSEFPHNFNNGSLNSASLKIEVDGKIKFNDLLSSISGEHYATDIILKNKLEIQNFREIKFSLETQTVGDAEIEVIFAQEE